MGRLLLILQWTIGLGLIATGFWRLTATTRATGMFEALFPALMAFALIITGTLVLAPTLAEWAAAPFLRFIDSIYLPGGRNPDRPAANHRLAEYYYRSRQFELAGEEYEKILSYHPGASRAYIAMVDILANRHKEPAKAARLYRRGLRRIRTRSGRNALRMAYGRGDVAPLELEEFEEDKPTTGHLVKFPDLRA